MGGLTLSDAIGNSLAATMVSRINSALPASFNGDGELFALNLFLMTTFMCLGLLMSGVMARAIWRHRGTNVWRHPVTIWRVSWLFASIALFLRCGAEAMSLWAWNPTDPITTARVLMAKRWVDPVALTLVGTWLMLIILSNTAMEQQLNRLPLPIDM